MFITQLGLSADVNQALDTSTGHILIDFQFKYAHIRELT